MHRVDSAHAHRFGAPDAPPTTGVAPAICERCFSDLVQPVEARAQAAGYVRLTLRCPECEHVRVGECSWEEARAFGRAFAAGKARLREARDELADEIFRDELDYFVLALAADLIGPDDFAPHRPAA